MYLQARPQCGRACSADGSARDSVITRRYCTTGGVVGCPSTARSIAIGYAEPFPSQQPRM